MRIDFRGSFPWSRCLECSVIDQEFNVVLANPAKIQTYSGLKHSDDKSDAFWLAEMLRLGRRERKWNLGTRR